MKFFLIAFLSFNLFAKKFSNEFIEFQLPNGWDCRTMGTEWLCQSSDALRQQEAIIIFTSKERNEEDNINSYFKYLKKKKSYTLPNNTTQLSDPKFVKKKNVHSQTWVDSLHLASEVPGFYTRYMATVKKDRGVVLTFSVHKSKYHLYKDLIDELLGTIKVFQQKTNSESFSRFKNMRETGYTLEKNFEDLSVNNKQTTRQGKSEDSSSDFIYFILLALVAGFLTKKKIDKGKKSSQRSDKAA